MRAVTFQEPGKVLVTDVAEPEISDAGDAIVQIDATGVCGSDLHIYHGRVQIEPGFTIGHEYVGTVLAAGDAVQNVAVGDRVLGCFQTACGHCFFCRRGWFHKCDSSRTFGHGAALGALQGAVGWWMVASGLADRIEVSQYRLATHLVLACLIYVALLWTAQRWDKPPTSAVPARIRFGAVALLILVLVQIYLGAIVAGLRAGRIYNTWPLIDGALVPDPARLFFNAPLWRNFFENTLTAQFDHRMLAYAIWIVALLHVFGVARAMKKGLALTGAVLLALAVTLQAALGIWTLLMVAPLSLALLHQAMAMVVLTVATVHAASVAEREPGSFLSSARTADPVVGDATGAAR